MGDFLIRELVDVTEHHGGAQRGRESVECRAQHLHAVALFQFRVRAARRRGWRQTGGVDVAVDRLVLPADAAVVIDTQVTADADQPGLEVRAPIEGIQRLEQLEEDVLREILGLVMPADELVRDVEHPAPIEAHDLVPGALIAVEAALDDRVDRMRRRG